MIKQIGIDKFKIRVKDRTFILEIHERNQYYQDNSPKVFYFTRENGGYRFSTIFKNYGFSFWGYSVYNFDYRKKILELCNAAFNSSGKNFDIHWNGCPCFDTKFELLSFFEYIDRNFGSKKEYKKDRFINIYI